MNYDLQIITSGYLGVTLGDIVTAVAPAIGAYPDYTYQRTEINGDVIHIFYSDDYADPSAAQAEIIPLVVYAILAVIGVLGIAYITYSLKEVAQSAPTMVYAGIFVAGMFALGYLIKSRKMGD